MNVLGRRLVTCARPAYRVELTDRFGLADLGLNALVGALIWYSNATLAPILGAGPPSGHWGKPDLPVPWMVFLFWQV